MKIFKESKLSITIGNFKFIQRVRTEETARKENSRNGE